MRCPAIARPRRRLRDLARRRARRWSQEGSADRRAAGRRRDRRCAARGDRERHADAALRPAARRRAATCPTMAANGRGASATAAAEMQIHLALSEPARWEGDERLGRTAIVHVTPGLDGVSRAVNEAERGLLPAEATVVVGQPLTMDASRAPDGAGLLWIQLQELPSRIRGDAAGEIDTGDGTWTRGAARALRRPRRRAPRASHPGPGGERSWRAPCSSPGRPGAGERQPRARRPVRRLARARPELPVAALRARAPGTRPPSTALAHRREHASGPGPGRRLGHARRAGSCFGRRCRSARSERAPRRSCAG